LVEKIANYLKNPGTKFVLTDVAIAELVWVLLSVYTLPKETIIEKIEGLIELSNFILSKSLISRTLALYSQNNIDYIDAYLAAYAIENEITEIVSYDKDLNKIKSLKRVEP
jgi:predicted nucleic-acid-binding protein